MCHDASSGTRGCSYRARLPKMDALLKRQMECDNPSAEIASFFLDAKVEEPC